MLLLGFFSGLPLALTGSTLQAWMKDSNVDLKVIGLFSLVGLPYTLKFLWSPLMDRFAPHFLGRRRFWMLLSQGGLFVAIITLGFSDPGNVPTMVATFALVIAFLSASQDIAVDAYRTDVLSADERGPGAGVFTLGYRVAMIISGAVALILADHLAWHHVYSIMAALMLLGMITTLLSPRPTDDALVPKSLREAVIDPFIDFFKRRSAHEILLFIVIYKIDIVMAVALTTPFMMDLGFTKTEIGAVQKLVGMIAAIVGSLVGGGLQVKLGLKRSLWWFGIIQGFATLSFALLAFIGKNNLAMATIVGFENFCAGLSTAPFVALLMTLCSKRFTATQYALLTSLAAVTRVFAGSPTGFLVEALGWEWFFVFCSLTAIPGLLLLRFRFDKWQTATTD